MNIRVNSDRTAAVDQEYFWIKDFTDCPRGVKLQLMGQGGVAVYGHWNGDPWWTHWAPLPKLP